jgi:hypothetical protein
MRHAGKDTYIATIADRDGWVFEHVFDAPSAVLAEREMREIGRYWGMTLIEVRRAPTLGPVVHVRSVRGKAAPSHDRGCIFAACPTHRTATR